MHPGDRCCHRGRRKELIAIADGTRECEQSWTEVLQDLRARGIEQAPEVAVGDGALGFWKAIAKVFPTTRAQRGWFHKSANVLNFFPKNKYASVLADLHEFWI